MKRLLAYILSAVIGLSAMPTVGAAAQTKELRTVQYAQTALASTGGTMSDYANMPMIEVNFTATNNQWHEKVYRIADNSAEKPYIVTFDYHLTASSGATVKFDSRAGYLTAVSGSSSKTLKTGRNTFVGKFYTSVDKGTFAPKITSTGKATLYIWNYRVEWDGAPAGGSTQDVEPSALISESVVSGFAWYDGDAPVVEEPITYNTAILYNEKHSTFDEQGEEMRQNIVNNTDDLSPSVNGKTYYVSPSGSDKNDGTSPSKAWRTVNAVSANSAKFKAGDVVLFERGGVYRGITQVTEGVSYGAYGEGPKPCLYASPRNYADEALWEQVATNIWRVKIPYLADVGNIVFDHGKVCASDYKIVEDAKMTFANLKKNFQYYHIDNDLQSSCLYMYYDGGNPAAKYSDIEFCQKNSVFYMGAHEIEVANVLIDNLCIKYAGSFGIVFRMSKNITVTNCEIGYIGGSEFNGKNDDGSIKYGRYGNGIEFNSHATDVLVDGNWIYQCYDAGYTNQGSGAKHTNLLITNNLVEYCHYNFEIFGSSVNDDGSLSGMLTNCVYEDNMLRFSGYGFGTNNRVGSNDSVCSNICYWYRRIPSTDVYIRNNILDSGFRFLLVAAYVNDQNALAPYVTGNTWVQHNGPKSAVALQVDTKVHGWLTFAEHELPATDLYTMQKSVAVVDTNPKDVIYNGPGLNGIVVTKKPNKTAYLVGEELDTTGMKLEMQYNGGATQAIKQWYTVTAPDMSTLGEKTVTVTYSNKTTSFTIVVAEPVGEIEKHPTSATVAKGAAAKFSVAVSGVPLAYQWQVRSSPEASWSKAGEPGNKTATITVTAYAPYNGYQYRCVITDAFGTKVASEPATLTVVTPKITSQPTNKTVAVNTKPTFTVAATGLNITYQWQVRTSSTGKWANTTTTGYKTNTITVSATAARSGYQYRCVVTDKAGNVATSNPATLTVVTPKITSQPTDKKVAVNAKPTFTVAATGLNITYQWQVRSSSTGKWANTTTTGYKTNTITVSATAARSGYQYRCVVTDKAGNVVTSNPATLTVVTPKITTQSKSVKAAKGAVVTFSVGATGLNLKYQWQLRYSSTAKWQTLHVGTYNKPTYTVTATGSVSGYQYRCIITDAAGNKLYSNVATLTAVTPKVTTQPQTVKAAKNQKVTFTVAATGVGLKYQWQLRTSSTGKWVNTTTSGYKTNKITVSATTARSGYQYRCVVTDEMGNTAASSAASLMVVTPKVSTHPTNVKVAKNTKPKFTVTATGVGIKYQWQVKKTASSAWANIKTTGYNTKTLTVTAYASYNGYQYRCVVTDAAGNKAYSTAAKLTVVSPKVTTQPKSIKVAKNTKVKFTVAATGLGIKYRWQVKKTASSAWANTSDAGCSTSTLYVTAYASYNGYQYRCVITDTAGNKAYSSAAKLTVVSPKITTQPKSVTVAKNKKATFTVAATGVGLKYQWQVRYSAKYAWRNIYTTGYNAKTFSVNGTMSVNGYQYRCIVTDAAGNQVYSSAAKLTVK